MAPIVTLKKLPTLQAQYDAGDLPALPEEGVPKYPFDKKLNERVTIWRGDITVLESDMIVNAANGSLLGGGGVDGAIHSAAGHKLLDECRTLNGAETGETKFTSAYDLPSKKIAHTVGPIYSSAERSAPLLASCYRSSLEGCRQYGGGSIGFSSISTGVYGYPVKDATHIALETTRKFLEQDDTVTNVIYVVFSKRDESVYHELVPIYFPGSDSTSSSSTEHTKAAGAAESTTPASTSPKKLTSEVKEASAEPTSSNAPVAAATADLAAGIVSAIAGATAGIAPGESSSEGAEAAEVAKEPLEEGWQEVDVAEAKDAPVTEDVGGDVSGPKYAPAADEGAREVKPEKVKSD
ncbi:LRP16 family protein [Cryptococcus wingfieldii CBS 7118]|uniref:LRP16 family protein n=1 Tax=Cryptococcus wingfieldii CBS 7118 TaxID=1295528 RepID=A0A1E3IHC3_9TREE|nr:LRP16 family protein [Cryptococcus wingfieldii CBS 7118]ODN87141.1 LRP16 family protein [Cryptococcus wingfieldii CBS 7118]